MTIVEKQAELGRTLYQINANTLKELATLQRDNIENYFATNRSFGEKLPAVKGIAEFVDLQREYGDALWQNMRKAVESHNDIVRAAFEDASEAMRTAFEPAGKESDAGASESGAAKKG